jgi:ribonucleoside-diphosphate reductase alpha chain
MELASEILSDITVFMKYAKYIDDLGRREAWRELVSRNKEMHIKKFPYMKEEIEIAYKPVYAKKILPSMRSMQFGGKPIEISPNRVYNCGYLPMDDYRAFNEILFLLLGGTGIGFSVQKHHVEKLPEIRKPRSDRKRRFLIGDSIEGWADSVKVLMRSYFEGTSTIDFDFSDIRAKGARLVTSGGKAPGPEPLKICIRQIKSILNEKKEGSQLEPIEVHDIVCHIADAVLAGGIRRAALISLFSADDEEMIACKTGDWQERNPHRQRANNSAVLVRHRVEKDFFDKVWDRIRHSQSGEPSIYFTNDKDWGTNPCCEIALRPFQFCNLCEVNVSNLESQEDLNERVRCAALIGTLQASYTDFHYLRSVWRRTTEKEALLGIGLTGVASGLAQKLDMKAASKVAKAENQRVAMLLGINPAARVTTIKPSGTSSLVLGCASGIHPWHNDYYIRRLRVSKNEDIYRHLYAFHPELVEDEYFRPHDSAVISVPQRAPQDATLRHETALELLERVKWFSQNWIRPGHRKGNNTHNISATVSIKEDEWDAVGEWMWDNRKYYNGLAVLPYDGGTYKQAPHEDCDELTYERLMTSLQEIDLTKVREEDDNTNLSGEIACGAGGCEVKYV